jgi:hypothetical protein
MERNFFILPIVFFLTSSSPVAQKDNSLYLVTLGLSQRELELCAMREEVGRAKLVASA